MKKPKYTKLKHDLDVDVAIVGGGLAGIDTAYMLSETGLNVAILESKTIGSGATSKTTAWISQIIDTSYVDMVSMFGSKKSRLVWEAHGEAINRIEKIVKTENIDCSFKRCSNYKFAVTDNELKELKEESDEMKKLGFKVRLHNKNIFKFPTVGTLEAPNQAKYRATLFLEQLAELCNKRGVQIFENTTVTKISGTKKIKIEAGGNIITAKKVIIATYDPFGNPKPTKFKKGMYLSYVMVLEVPKNKFPEALFEDIDNPYHYFRIDPSDKFDYMTIGGEDHRWEIPIDPKKNYRALEEYIKEAFPGLKYKIISRWNGPILEPTDGLPLIGEYEPNRYVACAFSGNGMSYSMIAAKIFHDLLTKPKSTKKNPYINLFDPKRTPSAKQLAKKAMDYGGEFVGGVLKNYFK